jgi:hypothetical protein
MLSFPFVGTSILSLIHLNSRTESVFGVLNIHHRITASLLLKGHLHIMIRKELSDSDSLSGSGESQVSSERGAQTFLTHTLTLTLTVSGADMAGAKFQ